MIVVVLVVIADGRVGGSLAGMVDGRGRRIEEQRSSERVEEEKTSETMRSSSFMNRRRRRMVRRGRVNNRRVWKGRQPFDDPFCQRADVCLIEGVRVAPAGGALRLRGKALGSRLWGLAAYRFP